VAPGSLSAATYFCQYAASCWQCLFLNDVHVHVNITTCRSADPSLSLGWLNIQLFTNKTDAVEELILERSIDVLALTETWHSAIDDVCLRLSTPPGYAVVDVARRSGRGGGVAIIFRKNLKCGLLLLPICDTFKAVCVRLTTTDGPILLVNIYRAGSMRPSAAFYDELASVLETLILHSGPVVIGVTSIFTSTKPITRKHADYTNCSQRSTSFNMSVRRRTAVEVLLISL